MANRKSGILLHPSSLPSAFGVGDFGQAAYTFLDRLAEAKQTLWQILPLVPTDAGGSPYSSASAFAGNPLLISPELLLEEGLLSEADLQNASVPPAARVDYEKAAAVKLPLLEKAFQAFQQKDTPADYAAFQAENAYWLDDYALYTALKQHFLSVRATEEATEGFDLFCEECAGLSLSEEKLHEYYDNVSWVSFPRGLKRRNALSLKKWRRQLAPAIEKEIFLQYIFQKQWQAVKAYANEKGISVIGDAPIFVSYDSADVWAHQKLFRLDSKGFPTCVTGVPPDYFSETGQLWGNPLYKWEYHKKTGYAWWMKRIRHCVELYDVIRIDHFRGFDEYYSIPYGDLTAEFGHWEKGPGMDIFRTVKETLGDVKIIAEDLGFLTDSVIRMVEESGYPGMKVLEFAFDSREPSNYLPHNYDKNCVVYTGTHDNETLAGWYRELKKEDKKFALRYMGRKKLSVNEAVWEIIRLAQSSVADTCIIPIQDYLGLGAEARINEPSTLGKNWKWRLLPGEITGDVLKQCRRMAKLYGRLPETVSDINM